MLKKIFAIWLLTIVSFWTVANATNVKSEINENWKSAVLSWSLFSERQAKTNFGQALKCEDYKDQIAKSVYDPDWFQEDIKWLQSTDPGQIKDIKWCVLENQSNQILRWIIYVAIICFALYTIIIVWKEVISGWKGWNSWGWDQGWDWNWGGWNKVLEKVSVPLWAMWILILIVLGALDLVVKFIAWIFHSLF